MNDKAASQPGDATRSKCYPKIQSGWSLYMESELAACTDDEILEATTAICQSWGDRRKWDNPTIVIARAIKDAAKRKEAVDRVAEWAAGGSQERAEKIATAIHPESGAGSKPERQGVKESN